MAATEALIAAGLSTAGSFGGSFLNNSFNRKEAQKQRDWSEQMVAEQNAWNEEQWNKTNEYNSPEAQVQRLRDAGLNPLYYGLDGSSAKAFESAQPLGYERAQASPIGNPIGQGVDTYMQMKSLSKDIELKNAQIDKLGADTTGVQLDNAFKDKTLEARAESEQLSNNLTKAQIGKIVEEKKQIEANIKKTVAETENESFRGLLIQAQTAVQKASEKQLIELLPYDKLLKEAQTEAQKYSAMASYYNALTQKGLLEAGYIDNYIDSMAADIGLKGSQKSNYDSVNAINEFKAAVKSGTIFTVSDSQSGATNAVNKFLNMMFADVSILGEALTGGLAGVLK